MPYLDSLHPHHEKPLWVFFGYMLVIRCRASFECTVAPGKVMFAWLHSSPLALSILAIADLFPALGLLHHPVFSFQSLTSSICAYSTSLAPVFKASPLSTSTFLCTASLGWHHYWYILHRITTCYCYPYQNYGCTI